MIMQVWYTVVNPTSCLPWHKKVNNTKIMSSMIIKFKNERILQEMKCVMDQHFSQFSIYLCCLALCPHLDCFVPVLVLSSKGQMLRLLFSLEMYVIVHSTEWIASIIRMCVPLSVILFGILVTNKTSTKKAMEIICMVPQLELFMKILWDRITRTGTESSSNGINQSVFMSHDIINKIVNKWQLGSWKFYDI